MEKSNCTVDGCDRIERAKALCDMHYQRLRHTGTVERRRWPTAEELFWAKVDKQGPVSTRRPDLGPCWMWTGCVLAGGYAFWQYGGRINKTKTTAHRYSYELAFGAIPTGLHIDHLCGTRICARPSH